MATDVEEFISDHGLETPILIGHSMFVCMFQRCSSITDGFDRGAKVAMTVALRSPGLPGALISVDNAPINAALESGFAGYVRGLQEIESAKVSKQVEADEILKPYEDVSLRVSES